VAVAQEPQAYPAVAEAAVDRHRQALVVVVARPERVAAAAAAVAPCPRLLGVEGEVGQLLSAAAAVEVE
jgi:hypothetical protein